MKASERIEYIKKWILNYCKSMSNEAKSLVVGVSGGIDSSVVSTICAMTGKKTFVVSMPIQQNKEQYNLSIKILKHLLFRLIIFLKIFKLHCQILIVYTVLQILVLD